MEDINYPCRVLQGRGGRQDSPLRVCTLDIVQATTILSLRPKPADEVTGRALQMWVWREDLSLKFRLVAKLSGYRVKKKKEKGEILPYIYFLMICGSFQQKAGKIAHSIWKMDFHHERLSPIKSNKIYTWIPKTQKHN